MDDNNFRAKHIDITIPVEEYNFLADYDDSFFQKTYPTMWKNICLEVEMRYGPDIEKDIRENRMLELRIEQAKLDYNFDDYTHTFDVTAYINEVIASKKREIATRIMKKKLKELNSLQYNGSTYILTDEEKKQIEAETRRKAREKYITIIDKNGIYAHIDRMEKKSVFKYKDGPKYNIETAMNRGGYRRFLTGREQEIIKQCAEANLHYHWIAQIFGFEDRFMNKTCKKLGYDNVFLTPQKLMKTAPRIKTLDSSGFFVVEQDNHLLHLADK